MELQLAEIINQSFTQCPTIGTQLRLLEVFEGISNRDLVQTHIKEQDQVLLRRFTDELLQVKTMFHFLVKNPPSHKNTPAVVSKMKWVYALRQRIQVGLNFNFMFFSADADSSLLPSFIVENIEIYIHL